MAETAAERAAKRFEEKLKAAEERAAKAGGGGRNDAAAKASASFEAKLRAAEQRAGQGGGGDDKGILGGMPVLGAVVRAGGRVLSSGPVAKTLDILDRPGQAVKGALVGAGEVWDDAVGGLGTGGRAGGGGRGPASKGAQPVFSKAARGFTGKERFTPQQVVKSTTGLDVPEGGVVGTTFGFAGDIALDPTTYLSFGAGAAAKRGLRKVSAELGPEAAAAISRHGLAEAGRRGLVDVDEVTEVIRRTTEAQKGIELAKGGAAKVVDRETSALARRGAGGMVLGGRTVIKGQGVPGRVLGAPFVLPARAIAASPPARVVRTALSTKAPIARVAGDDAAARVAEAESKMRAHADNVRYDVAKDFQRLIQSTRATEKELEDVLLRHSEGLPSFDMPERLRPLADKLNEVGRTTTSEGLAAEMLAAAKLHDEATYLLRMTTPAGRKRLRGPGATPHQRLSDAQQAARQGGSVMPRTFLPEAGVQAVEVELRRLLGPLPRGQRYLVHNAAKLRTARASSMAEAVALSRFVDDLSGITDEAGNPLLDLGNTKVQKAMSKEQEAAIRDLRVASNEAARRSERAVKAADELTSAQDLAVAARIQPPRPAVVPPSTGPVLSAAGRATGSALPDVERRAVAASRAAREAADASSEARATRAAVEGDARVPSEARKIVKSAREERKVIAQSELDDAVGEYERLYQGNRKIAHPPDRKLVGHDPITRRPIYARRESAQGDLWEWWDDLGKSEQQRLIRMGWVARKGERGIQPDEMAEFAHRADNYGNDVPDTGVEMQKWHARVTKIDDLSQRARRDPVPVANELDEVVQRGPASIFDEPNYDAFRWHDDFNRIRALLKSTPADAPERVALQQQMAEMAPEGLFEAAKGKTYEEAFEIARDLAAERAAKTFTGAGRLSASEDAVRAAVDAGSAEGLTKAQRTLYDAVVKAAKGEAADTTLGAARLKAVDRITAAVAPAAEKLAAKATAAGRREGMVAGRAAGRDMAEAQLKRARAAQTATAEGRRAQAAATRRDVLAKQVDDMEAERIVLASPREGMVPVKIGEREVFAIPEVAEKLNKISGIMSDDESIRGALRFYDRVLNMGKGLATVPLTGFGFHSRNAQGNFILNMLAGVSDPRWYARSFTIQKKLLRNQPLTAREQKIIDLAREHGVFNRGSQEADLARPDALSKLGGVGAGGKARRLLNPVSDEFVPVATGRTVGSAVENNARLAHFMWAMDKMGDAERASMSVKKYLFDYADLTDFERNFLKRVIPFYTFMRKNTPLQMAKLVEQPGKFTGLAHLLVEPNEEYAVDVPIMAATKAVTAPFQPSGLASLTGLGLAGAFKSQAFGKTIPKTGTEGYQQIPAGSGSESRLDVLLADLNPLYGKYGKVSSAYRQIDEGEWLRFFLGLRRREEEPAR